MIPRFAPLFIAPLVLGASLAGCNTSPHDEFDPNRANAEIRNLENSWAQVAVSGDPTVIEANFSDDFLGVSPDGTQYTKQGFIDDTRAHPPGFTANVLNDVKVRYFGNIAVAQGDETFTRKSGEQGRFVWTDVLLRADGRWQIVAAQDAIASLRATGADGLFAQSNPGEADRLEIDRVRESYVAAWKSASAERLAALYTEDARVLYPDQPPVSGRAAIKSYFDGFFREFTDHDFALRSSEVVIAGAWAFDSGTYQWTARSGNERVGDDGKYLVVLRRSADGAWLLARDMDNSNRAATQATRGSR